MQKIFLPEQKTFSEQNINFNTRIKIYCLSDYFADDEQIYTLILNFKLVADLEGFNTPSRYGWT